MPPSPPRFPGRISDWIVANNHQFIAFNKPAGLAVQSGRDGQISLREMGSAFCRTELKVINRLDQPVSGLVLYGKKDAATRRLSELFRQRGIQKTYLAVVATNDLPATGTLEHHLLTVQGKPTKVLPQATTDSKLARLHYQRLAAGDRYQILQIELETGYTHQIRVQLAALDSPVRGDRKYGFKRSNEGGGIDLHAWRLRFPHPVSGEDVALEAPIPDGKVWEIVK